MPLPVDLRRLPDFLVIGAAKSGTTTLYRYLSATPRVYMTSVKEPCFFDSAVGWDKGLAWYRALFSAASEGQVCGEASTNYTRWPQVPAVPQRIADILPDVKFIYLMRHPIERAYSHFVHRYSKEVYPGKPFTMTFEDFVSADPMCLDSSNYALQLDQYFAYFPPSRFLLLLLEDLVEDPLAVLRRVGFFLGIRDGIDVSGDARVAANQSSRFMEHAIRAKITAPFRASPLIRRVARALPASWREKSTALLMQTGYGRRVRSSFTPAPMKADTRRQLIERFRASNERVSEMMGVDLSHWNR